MTKSDFDLRPKPPPSSVTWIVTRSSGMPSSFATSARLACGFCVGAQISARPSATRAIATSGSICRCERCGTTYSASTVFAALANAASTLPTSRCTVPGARTDASSSSRNAAELNEALSPWSQVIASAARPFIAAQVFSATTAMPPHGWNSHGGFGTGISTICVTPGTARARAASYLATFPPTAGGRAITATSIPGSVTSAPNCAVPVTIAAPSRTGRFRSATRSSSETGRSTRSLASGTGSLEAAATTSANARVRFVGVWMTRWFFVVHVCGGTFHCFAAAAISIIRAAAPARRSASYCLRKLDEPSVFWSPYFLSPSACLTTTRFMSAPSSSAISTGSELRMPCPISER